MKLARIKTTQGPTQVALRDGRWHAVKSIFTDTLEFTGESYAEGEVEFLAPTEPRVILGMAHNGTKGDLARLPQSFHKSARSVCGPNDSIYKEESLGLMNVECELVAVIKKRARNLTAENALEHVLGFTIGNDVTMPEQTLIDNLLLQTKNGDGFTPLGPWIETNFPNPDDVKVFVNVNGKRVIESSTNQLARGVVEQLIFITKYMTLGEGDVVLGGSPTTWFPVNAGDVVEMEIDGIGILSNHIIRI
jgi:2-keto-4-pentenoate hydratase/2-oxohepta-3-ene-1,7-dioic acid hydratase in catechol pathway